jgi:hypothetical protein
MFEFLRSRQWVLGRRLFLVSVVIVVAIRQYGGGVVSLLQRPNAVRDIVITHVEFRAELPGAKPAWIIGFRNNSSKFTYDQIQLEATYTDDQARVLETDKLVVHQKLFPGDEKLVGSVDFKSRGAASGGTVKLIRAEAVK